MFYVGVIGAGAPLEEDARIAREVGRYVARSGAVLVCGGLGGVMEQACRGAREEGGTTIGVLPTGSRQDANPYVDFSIVTGLGEARNSVVARSSDGLVAVGGSYGTLSEIAFALKLCKPVAAINSWKLQRGDGKPVPLIRCTDAETAVQQVVTRLKQRSTPGERS